MKYSVIVPVYNRPDEVKELLESLSGQEYTNFEVIIVEDGSSVPCKDICLQFADKLQIHYFFKPNSGPSQSRNYGANHAKGDYLIILDSDVVVPKGYFKAINEELDKQYADAFGGPDRADDSFTNTQKAISYAMTSFFTTGGIRGGKKKLDKFYPRSFNMGVKREVYAELGGFSKMRFGEDIDFSIRIFKADKQCRLFPDAWVYHKRRTDFRKFWRQVFNSGIARINLYKKYPESLKLVHLLPMVFTLGVGICLLVTLIGLLCYLLQCCHYFPTAGNNTQELLHFSSSALILLGLTPLVLYSMLIFVCSTRESKSLSVGLLSIIAAFVQLTSYGCGFLKAWWKRCVKGQGEFKAYQKNFYK